MKNASNPRRGRGRNNGKRNQNSRGSGVDNDGKIRGSAQQVLDKYLTLARDATSSGDRIAAEGYFQHAEHYQRVLNQDGGRANNQQNRGRNNEVNKGQARTRPKSEDPSAKEFVEETVLAEKDNNELKENPHESNDTKGEAAENPRRRARNKTEDTLSGKEVDEETSKSIA